MIKCIGSLRSQTPSPKLLRVDFVATAPPGPPQSITVASVSTNSVQLSWSPPSPSQPPSAAVTGYSVTCSTTGRPTRSVQTSNTEATVGSLLPATRYSCCVAADSSAGNGERACHSLETEDTSEFAFLSSIQFV